MCEWMKNECRRCVDVVCPLVAVHGDMVMVTVIVQGWRSR